MVKSPVLQENFSTAPTNDSRCPTSLVEVQKEILRAQATERCLRLNSTGGSYTFEMMARSIAMTIASWERSLDKLASISGNSVAEFYNKLMKGNEQPQSPVLSESTVSSDSDDSDYGSTTSNTVTQQPIRHNVDAKSWSLAHLKPRDYSKLKRSRFNNNVKKRV